MYIQANSLKIELKDVSKQDNEKIVVSYVVPFLFQRHSSHCLGIVSASAMMFD